jgi:exodeoxyribonuclease V gamma subunit
VLAASRTRLEVPARAFLSGGVTFCAMVPMRSLPFEVVCMIGMNDTAYPRMRRRDGFDLMAGELRKGDRSRRDDDRYLFLESVLNARRALYVSYTGRHIREDTAMPPSVLVSELLDYVARGLRTEDGRDARAHLVTEHPLQPFSPRYFAGDERLFSYSQPFARAAAASRRDRSISQPLVTGELPPLDALERKVDLETLVRFFRNPVRHLFETRLKVKLEAAEDELESHEPFHFEGLPLYMLKERLLEMRLRGEKDEGCALARASGVLPHGPVGEALFEEQDGLVHAVVAKARKFIGGAPIEPIAFELGSDNITLTGTLTRVTAEGMLTYRVAKASANVRVSAWIRHLALNAFAPRGAGRTSRCIAEDYLLTFPPVADARERLLELLGLYWTGMHRTLPFFPRTACEYAKQGELGYKAWNVWKGSYPNYRGEGADPYFALAFRGLDALDADFERTAQIVFGPMIAVIDEERLQ